MSSDVDPPLPRVCGGRDLRCGVGAGLLGLDERRDTSIRGPRPVHASVRVACSVPATGQHVAGASVVHCHCCLPRSHTCTWRRWSPSLFGSWAASSAPEGRLQRQPAVRRAWRGMGWRAPAVRWSPWTGRLPLGEFRRSSPSRWRRHRFRAGQRSGSPASADSIRQSCRPTSSQWHRPRSRSGSSA